MYISQLIYTLFSFLLAFFFGKLIGRMYASLLTVMFLALSWLESLYALFIIISNKTHYYYSFYEFINIDFLQVYIGFQIDTVTVIMLVVVTTVSFFTHIYSIEYMKNDPFQTRFMAYLSLFTFFMLILVTADNLFQLFVGWEGVGICSYLLISFWFTRIQANKSSIIAILTNKIGDIALLLGIAILISYYKSISFVELNYLVNIGYNEYKLVYLTGICFIIAAVGKSAQVGLHIWLPEAMEGPTPVSSLIHAATMVTAGIFLIIRSSFVFEQIPEILSWIILIGSITAFMGATIGIFQHDIKKIIAYSTCSQLGYMFLACGYSNYNGSLFHLFNHAFFKALLFLTAGYVIHANMNEQDMRKMGGLLKILPLSYLMILIGSLSIMGFPFFSGFYSKEKILELIYAKFYISSNSFNLYNSTIYFSYILSMLTIIFTILYSSKIIIYTYYNLTSHWKSILYNISSNQSIKATTILFTPNVHYATFFILTPLLFLSCLSVVSGYLFQDMFVGQGTDFWNDSLAFNMNSYSNLYILEYMTAIGNDNFLLFQFEFNKYIRRIPFIWTIYYTILFILIYSFYKKVFLTLTIGHYWTRTIHFILVEKYIYFSKLMIEPISYKILNFSKNVCYIFFDKGIIELIGPHGITKLFQHAGLNYNKYQTSYLYHNLHIILITTLLFLQFVFLLQ